MAGAARSLSPQPLRTSHSGTRDVEVIDAKCATVVRTGPLVLTQGTAGRPYEGPCPRSWLGRESPKGSRYLWPEEVTFTGPEPVYARTGSRGCPGERDSFHSFPSNGRRVPRGRRAREGVPDTARCTGVARTRRRMRPRQQRQSGEHDECLSRRWPRRRMPSGTAPPER